MTAHAPTARQPFPCSGRQSARIENTGKDLPQVCLSVEMAARQHLALRLASGALLRVSSGTAWITQDGHCQDIVLGAGESHSLRGRGTVLVSAIGAARLCVQGGAEVAAPPRHRAGWSIMHALFE